MVTLTSAVFPNYVLVLPNPVFGDTHTITFKRVNRITRGNDLILRGEPGWNPTFQHKYEWDYLTFNQKYTLKTFIEDHVGLPFFVTDIYGINWKVIHTRPDAEVSQPGFDNRSMTLDMQEVQ